MGETLRVLLFLSLATVAPGTHQLQNNTSRVCSLLDYVEYANCNEIRHLSLLSCRGGFTQHWIKGIRRDILHLKVERWPGHCFNVSQLQHHFPELRSLEFTNCTTLAIFEGRFQSDSRIENISMHGMSSLWEVPPEMVLEMQRLQEMDLRRNMLRHMRGSLFSGPPRLERVFLSDNMWDCSDGGLDWLALEQDNGTIKSRIADYEDLVCHQRLYKGKPLHTVMDIIRNMRETCPEPCSCLMTHVVADASGAVIPIITVDCASRQLTTPPDDIPPSTTTLKLEGNQISSLWPIIHNYFRHNKLVDLYLDNNTLTTVKELEATDWFASFRVLSLRGNQLKQIPVYAFDKALKTNNNVMHVFLGHNPWRCDCHFIPRFQAFLRKYRRVIKDLPDIRCSQSDDKQTSLIQISTMPLGRVCKSGNEMPISIINIVNIVLFTLILIILGRFLYDWHSFKKTGKLPWLSSILP